MAKKRQTRRQKILAATRRNTLDNVIEILPSVSVEEPRVNTHTTDLPAQAGFKTYTYVLADAQKTLVVVSILAALNVLLFITLKLKIISLFGLMF